MNEARNIKKEIVQHLKSKGLKKANITRFGDSDISGSKSITINTEGYSIGRDYVRFYFVGDTMEKVEKIESELKEKGLDVFIDNYDVIMIK